mmetsp:Transcript_20111/g.43894  ORF Transcript_20111/g.43894 Transcript_20111/m.43894 type:complete len:785 (-) Transcript_20111:4273-6627(-)
MDVGVDTDSDSSHEEEQQQQQPPKAKRTRRSEPNESSRNETSSEKRTRLEQQRRRAEEWSRRRTAADSDARANAFSPERDDDEEGKTETHASVVQPGGGVPVQQQQQRQQPVASNYVPPFMNWGRVGAAGAASTAGAANQAATQVPSAASSAPSAAGSGDGSGDGWWNRFVGGGAGTGAGGQSAAPLSSSSSATTTTTGTTSAAAGFRSNAAAAAATANAGRTGTGTGAGSTGTDVALFDQARRGYEQIDAQQQRMQRQREEEVAVVMRRDAAAAATANGNANNVNGDANGNANGAVPVGMHQDSYEEQDQEADAKKGGIVSRVIHFFLSPFVTLITKMANFVSNLIYLLGCLLLLLLGIAAIALVFSAVWPNADKPALLLDWTSGGGSRAAAASRKADYQPPCLSDSPGVPSIEMEDEMGDGWWTDVPPALSVAKIKTCHQGPPGSSSSSSSLPCPPHGRCAHGFLVDCLGDGGEKSVDASLYQVSDTTFAECIPSLEAEKIVSTVQSAVVDLTVKQTCNLGCRWGINLPGFGPSSSISCGGISPDDVLTTRSKSDLKEYLFTVDGLVGAIASPDVTAEVIEKLEPHFDKDVVQYIVGYKADAKDDEGPSILEPRIGLTPDFVKAKLPISWSCWAILLLLDALLYFATLFIDTACAYPLPTLFGLFVMYRGMRKLHEKYLSWKHQHEIAELREKVLDKLSLHDKPYPHLFLRDEMARELYPTSKKKRGYLVKTLWPILVVETKHDNSFQKKTMVAAGKPLVHWWMNNPADKKARSERQLKKTN